MVHFSIKPIILSVLINCITALLQLLFKTLPIPLLIFSLWQVANAQPNLTFTKLTEDDGLSNGFITTIFQDSKGFLWLGTAKGLNRFDGYDFTIYLPDENAQGYLSNEVVWSIAEDEAGHIWVGTNHGLNRLDPCTGWVDVFLHDPADKSTLSSSSIMEICLDRQGSVWVATAEGLNRFLPESQTFKRYLSGETIRYVMQSRRGVLWTCQKDTLYNYQEETDTFLPYLIPGQNPAVNEIRLIYETSDGYLWLGTQLNGVFCFDPEAKQFIRHFAHHPDDLNSLSHNKISAFVEQGQTLWIGTTGGGLNILELQTGHIKRYTGTPPDPNGVNSETIRDILKDSHGNIWLGSFYDGLYQWKSNQAIFENYDETAGLPAKKVDDIVETSDGRIWIALSTGGMIVYDPEVRQITRSWQHDPGNPNSLPFGNLQQLWVAEDGLIWIITVSNGISIFDPNTEVFSTVLKKENIAGEVCLDFVECILPQPNGDFWIGTQEGLCKYDKSTGEITSYVLPMTTNMEVNHGDNRFVIDLLRDRQDRIWVSTYGGLNRYQPRVDSFVFTPFQHQILEVYEDTSGQLWVGSTSGLFKFDPLKEAFLPLDAKELEGRSVTGILEDKRGNLWFSTEIAVQRYDPLKGSFTSYNTKDGLGSSFWKSYCASNGYLYFGGIEGLSIFHPDSIADKPLAPEVALTNFLLFNEPVPLQGALVDTLGWPSPLTQLITCTPSLTLKHWQNYFSFEFAALDLTAPENMRYRYQLDGYDEDWQFTNGDRRFVTYTNLNPSNYTFRVQAMTQKSDWSTNEALVNIRILPPWYRTWWAYLIFTLIAFLLIRTLYVFQLRRRLAQAEVEKYRELDAVKTRLFTNVTHEFRTPLTVILGMAQQIKTEPTVWLTEGVDAITRNGRQLLKLVNQMLDLSRLEVHNMPVHYQQGDVVAYLSYLVESFQSYAATCGVDLNLIPRPESLHMDFEPELLAKVLNNLLSNALKFTPTGGSVQVRIEQNADHLSLIVEDNGVGIPSEQQAHIFDRFFQTDSAAFRGAEGTGIGLALVRELVELMEGSISVRSRTNVSTIFQVLLPIRRQAPAWSGDLEGYAIVLEEGRLSQVDQKGVNEEAALVLIIEDNADVARYIAACLQRDYRIMLAENGVIGVEKALASTPDMVICDVMMPEMDGYQVCKILKDDERTSHIPIVMLTAKADDRSRLEGLHHGADVYLTKPFIREELEVRLSKLIEIRRRLREKYADYPSAILASAVNTNREDGFLQKLKKLVHDHLDEDGFGIAEVCQKLAISRSQLHRKVKALTGRPASHVIRSIRLHRAKELLKSSDLNISEIAYATGFQNLSYFSASFVEEFGTTPSNLRKNAI